MKNEQDYRTAVNGVEHGVILVKREDNVDTAYGNFQNIFDEDMVFVSEQEENEINASLNFL